MNDSKSRSKDERNLLPSDRAVMKLLLQGKSRDDICRELVMPMGTVNTCCTRIYRQLDCQNLVELILRYGEPQMRTAAVNQ